MIETIETDRNFFNIAETAKIMRVHRNTVANMIEDGRLKTKVIGKRKMIHSSEIDKLQMGFSKVDENLLELDLKITIKMEELQELMDQRKNYKKLTRDQFLDKLNELRKSFSKED